MGQVSPQAGYMRFRSFPMNERGRDFVVGDIHGAFDLVAQGMRRVKFDPKVDRLFVNGDTVDRGEESIRARNFLSLPYVFCNAGNHERTGLRSMQMDHLTSSQWRRTHALRAKDLNGG